jgi:hypothetical protein
MFRPLNKITKGGQGYTRPAIVAATIEAALKLGLDEQLRRANIRNPKDPGFMRMECLVYLWREARLTNNRSQDKFLVILLSRCEARFKRTIPGTWPDAESLREDALQTFCEILARVGSNHDATALDIYECKFNLALATLGFRVKKKSHNYNKMFLSLEDEKDDDGKPIDPTGALARTERIAKTPASQEHFMILQEVLAFIKTLPAAQRRAVELVCIQGYPPGSEDPDIVTAASISGVSETAIRKNLKKAGGKLNKYFEES